MWAYLIICFIWLDKASRAKIGARWGTSTFRIGLRCVITLSSVGMGYLDYLGKTTGGIFVVAASLILYTLAVVVTYYIGARVLLTRKVRRGSVRHGAIACKLCYQYSWQDEALFPPELYRFKSLSILNRLRCRRAQHVRRTQLPHNLPLREGQSIPRPFSHLPPPLLLLGPAFPHVERHLLRATHPGCPTRTPGPHHHLREPCGQLTDQRRPFWCRGGRQVSTQSGHSSRRTRQGGARLQQGAVLRDE